MKEERNIIEIRIAAIKRLFMWHFLNRYLDLILVSEFPKCGGSWFSQLLSDAIGIPFPRNESPRFRRCLLHGHHLYNNNYGKIIGVMRDGRDTMVSSYYHYLFDSDRNASFSVMKHRKKVQFSDYSDIQFNLPRWIEYMFTEYADRFFRFTWSEAVNSYFEEEDVCIVKYEDILTDAVAELNKAIHFLELDSVKEEKLHEIVDKYSFENQSNRKKGEEDTKSFLRKGIAGDWKNHFSLEACKVFDEYAGKELIITGYEKDNSWIDNYC
jgi:hypothetical protein